MDNDIYLSKEVKGVILAFVMIMGLALLGLPLVKMIFLWLLGIVVIGTAQMVGWGKSWLIIGGILAIGGIMIGITAIESGHYLATQTQDNVSTGGTITAVLINDDSMSNSAVYGYTSLHIEGAENWEDVADSPELSRQVNISVLGGGIMIALVTTLLWIVPTNASNPFALLYSVMFAIHNFPLIANDSSVVMDNGVMPAWLGWAGFIVPMGLIFIGLLVSRKRGEPIL